MIFLCLDQLKWVINYFLPVLLLQQRVRCIFSSFRFRCLRGHFRQTGSLLSFYSSCYFRSHVHPRCSLQTLLKNKNKSFVSDALTLSWVNFNRALLPLLLGSEIWTSMNFEWSKRGWVKNCPDFKLDLKSGSPTILNPDKWQPFCQKLFEILTKMSEF